MPLRMTPMDRAFFLLETEQRPMNVGLLFVVNPPRADRDRPADELVRRMLRCPVGPPFNRMLRPGRWPVLVEHCDLDPAQQLFRHRLPRDSELAALFARICTLHSRRLDRARPLWEMHVFDGLAGGRVGLYFKSHHGLIDGLGFLEVVRRTVGHTAGSNSPQAIWGGLPDTATGGTDSPAVSAAAAAPAAATTWQRGLATARTVNDLGRLLWRLGLRDLGLGDGFALPFIGTPNVLKAVPSPNRILGHCSVPLAQVRAVAQAGQATVNDVLLTVVDLALGAYLGARGVSVTAPLVADMPVALHDDGGAGNRITILQVPLGRPGGSPAQRLADVARETRAVKREVGRLAADALFFYSIFEHAVASAIETFNLNELPMLANFVLSNPTGLDRPVHFNGMPVELALPISVVAHHQALNVTVTNYGEHLHLTFIAVREALPDVQRLADGSLLALDALARALGRPSERASRHRARSGLRPPAPMTHVTLH